ncbi:MAG: hypothetical protein EHM85_12340 [Desulfobacteraceae bacterium]|nr:MAG: hypothetical protein EHM85_12340 [Desulfobacteraceae bacterium]
MKKLILIFFSLLLICLIKSPAPLGAEDTNTSKKEAEAIGDGDLPIAIQGIIKEKFSYELRLLTYGSYLSPATSTQNPGNNFLKLQSYEADLEVRPDLRLNLEFLTLSAKPRMLFEKKIWEIGAMDGNSKSRDDWFINEWLARLKVSENIFFSYGRENLQWGPSYLFSPSNPFFTDNGRNNPKREVPGMDFARLVIIPESSWTVSLITNTDEGRNITDSPVSFSKSFALKVDYTGRENYGSIILSHREDSTEKLGMFGGSTVSDAFIIYGEGSVAKSSRALYPVEDGSPFGASMKRIHSEDSDLKPVLLAGGSYTFLSGGTLTLEYVYNGSGYSDSEAENYYGLRRRAAEAFSSGSQLSGLSRLILSETFNTGHRFLRKNYSLLQYNHNDIQDTLDFTFRLTHNLDDSSFQFIAIGGYSLGDHLELFSVITINSGRGDSEFGSLVKSQVMAGIEYTF